MKANPSRGAGTGGGGGLRSVSERFSVVGGSGVAGARGLRGANAGARIVGSTRAQRQDAVVKVVKLPCVVVYILASFSDEKFF